MTWLHYLVAGAILTVCALLVIIILLQKGRGGGLTAAFGGGGSGSAFGAKTGDVFTWITVAFAMLFLVLTVVGNFVFRQDIVVTPPGLAAPGDTAPTQAESTPTDPPVSPIATVELGNTTATGTPVQPTEQVPTSGDAGDAEGQPAKNEAAGQPGEPVQDSADDPTQDSNKPGDATAEPSAVDESGDQKPDPNGG